MAEAPAGAALCFQEVVRSHPFPNGNGRLGRAFFHGALALVLDLPCPFLPLGPVMYLHAPVLTTRLRAAATGKDVAGYLAAMRTVVADALDLAD